MPRKDGFQTCKEIRAWEQNHGCAKIPIVALSAYVMSDMVDKCKESGFTRYLSKPVVFQQLKGMSMNLSSTVDCDSFANWR